MRTIIGKQKLQFILFNIIILFDYYELTVMKMEKIVYIYYYYVWIIIF